MIASCFYFFLNLQLFWFFFGFLFKLTSFFSNRTLYCHFCFLLDFFPRIRCVVFLLCFNNVPFQFFFGVTVSKITASWSVIFQNLSINKSRTSSSSNVSNSNLAASVVSAASSASGVFSCSRWRVNKLYLPKVIFCLFRKRPWPLSRLLWSPFLIPPQVIFARIFFFSLQLETVLTLIVFEPHCNRCCLRF